MMRCFVIALSLILRYLHNIINLLALNMARGVAGRYAKFFSSTNYIGKVIESGQSVLVNASNFTFPQF